MPGWQRGWALQPHRSDGLCPSRHTLAHCALAGLLVCTWALEARRSLAACFPKWIIIFGQQTRFHSNSHYSSGTHLPPRLVNIPGREPQPESPSPRATESVGLPCAQEPALPASARALLMLLGRPRFRDHYTHNRYPAPSQGHLSCLSAKGSGERGGQGEKGGRGRGEGCPCCNSPQVFWSGTAQSHTGACQSTARCLKLSSEWNQSRNNQHLCTPITTNHVSRKAFCFKHHLESSRERKKFNHYFSYYDSTHILDCSVHSTCRLPDKTLPFSCFQLLVQRKPQSTKKLRCETLGKECQVRTYSLMRKSVSSRRTSRTLTVQSLFFYRSWTKAHPEHKQRNSWGSSRRDDQPSYLPSGKQYLPVLVFC